MHTYMHIHTYIHIHIHTYPYTYIHSRVARRTIYTFHSTRALPIRLHLDSNDTLNRSTCVYSATGDRSVYMYICIFVYRYMFLCLCVCMFVRLCVERAPQPIPKAPHPLTEPQKAPKPSNLNKNLILKNPSSHFLVFRAVGIAPRPHRDHHQATTRPPK